MNLSLITAGDNGQVIVEPRHGVVPERDEAVPFAVQGRERLLRRLGQAGALTAPLRQVPHHPVRVVSELHRRARLALRPAWLTAALLPQRLRRRLRQPVRRRGLELFCEFCPTLAAKSATRDSSPAVRSRSSAASARSAPAPRPALAAPRSPPHAPPAAPAAARSQHAAARHRQEPAHRARAAGSHTRHHTSNRETSNLCAAHTAKREEIYLVTSSYARRR